MGTTSFGARRGLSLHVSGGAESRAVEYEVHLQDEEEDISLSLLDFLPPGERRRQARPRYIGYTLHTCVTSSYLIPYHFSVPLASPETLRVLQECGLPLPPSSNQSQDGEGRVEAGESLSAYLGLE